jgi:hypothetical protein
VSFFHSDFSKNTDRVTIQKQESKVEEQVREELESIRFGWILVSAKCALGFQGTPLGKKSPNNGSTTWSSGRSCRHLHVLFVSYETLHVCLFILISNIPFLLQFRERAVSCHFDRGILLTCLNHYSLWRFRLKRRDRHFSVSPKLLLQLGSVETW